MNNSLRYSLLSVVLLTACATSDKIQVQKVGDQRLSCSEIEREVAELDRVQNDIDDNKGFTGTNVAAALFWLPGLAYTYYDAGQAEELVSERRAYLTSLYNSKDCGSGF